MVWFWYLLIYSFLGFLVEVAYVRVVGGEKRDRKCRLLLPLCPVYGVGALVLLWMPEPIRENPLFLFPAAVVACTTVEYLTGLFYEKVFLVSFWDYSHLPLNVRGRVCPLFSIGWGVLALLVLSVIHPWVTLLVEALPPWLALPTLLLVGADTIVTALLLRQSRDTNCLRWYLRRQRRTA